MTNIAAVATFSWDEVIADGPLMIQFTNRGATIALGDNWVFDSVYRQEIGSAILRSCAVLFDDPKVKTQILALATGGQFEAI